MNSNTSICKEKKNTAQILKMVGENRIKKGLVLYENDHNGKITENISV